MLDELKLHPRESYDMIIRRLIEARMDDEPFSEETLRRIEEALEDVKANRVYTMREVREELEAGRNG
ncbi:MAG: hypothetical protein DRJ38_04150 [Thermoprotei archaeon]|nr:MAG: hypothetical protein DRJ38_04150 [Thermoprotei archaeon]